ncbi:MAG TPA: efflux RND transporter periplasmic adaptor subunit [Psychrobacter pasteurii]|nr:efflux RND transporter periplasmic adaptor subunit [Psychrobacter pasteurii]
MNAMKKPSPIMLRNIIITLVIVGVIALIIYGLNKSKQSTEKPLIIQGQMEMQSTAIAAKVPGRISNIMVTEGDTVTAGQQLIEMDSPEITAKMNQALAARDMAQSQLNKAENGARPQEIGQAKAAWQANQAAADLAKSTYERVNRLYEEGLMARQKRDEAYTQYVANQDKADAARLQYDLALEGAREEDKDAAKAQVAQVDGKIEEAQAAQDEANLKSPISGIVDDVIVNPGEVIGQGVPIMTLVDPNDQWVVLNITENVLHQFSIGKEFVGKVPALSSPDNSYQMTFKVFNTAALSDFATWRATNTEDNLDVRTFEVKARPTKPDTKIRSGMSVVVELDAKLVNKKSNVAN